MYSYGKTLFRVNSSKFSTENLENSRGNVLSLSLLRKDANLSRLEVLRNLYESINRNFTQVFLSLFLVFLTFFVNEIYFSFVIGSKSTCPSYAVAISLMIKCAYHNRINYEKQWECNANLYNISCNLNRWDLCIDQSNGNDRALACRLAQTIFRIRDNMWRC